MLMSDYYYVFPDIHGRYDLLYLALNKLYHDHPEGGKIIFLGDYIDRGPNNKKVLETVMNPPDNWNFICLLGNHEQMFLDSYLDCYEAPNNIIPFYDINVLKEYNSEAKTEIELANSFPTDIVLWMQDLKLFHFEDDNVFSHADYDDSIPPEYQDKNRNIWNRYNDFDPFISIQGRLHLTHGHTPRKHGPLSALNRTNLDCGAYKHNRYVIGKYKQKVKGPIDFLEFEVQ